MSQKGWKWLKKHRNDYDVYGSQQLERGQIGNKQTPVFRIILAVVLTAVVTIVTYLLINIIQYVRYDFECMDLRWGFEENMYYAVSSGNYKNDYTDRYYEVDIDGNKINDIIYDNAEDVPIPDWYIDYKNKIDNLDKNMLTISDFVKTPNKTNIFGTIFVSGSFFLLFSLFLMKNLDAQNLMNDTSDINQYPNDQHIAFPEEVQDKFDWFPDVGCTSSVSVTALISHVALSNNGIKKVSVPVRYQKTTYDENGDIINYAGEIKYDTNGNIIYQKTALFDKTFGKSLFKDSDVPRHLRKWYLPKSIRYNYKNEYRDKLKGYKRVSDLINEEWCLPDYEPQRPAGAYLVDTSPTNTMLLAITRGGKGQTYIEPTLDMWSREKEPSNVVVNDSKGELWVKNCVKFVRRGYQVIPLNLINVMKSDIYNPLALAADSAREGDFKKCAAYVGNIAEVFFPVVEGEDPVWSNAANNAFKRAAYGLIAFFLEEEKEMRENAEKNGTNEKVLETQIDEMWGKVTLYNCYQMMVQLSAKKLTNPLSEFMMDSQAGKFNQARSVVDEKTGEVKNLPAGEEPLTLEQYKEREKEMRALSKDYWEGRPEMDMLTLLFNAMMHLPHNSMRRLVGDANNSLRAMGNAEKMLASVYGIAITAMSFFADPTITALTSGTPSQNIDLGSFSFPRRMGVRFHPDYIAMNHLKGVRCCWQAYSDEHFTKSLGKDFSHIDTVTLEGWARFFFKGIFPDDVAYIKLELENPNTDMALGRFYFKFTKSYQTTLDGNYYVTEPILGEKIVKNGILQELMPVYNDNGYPVVDKETGESIYAPNHVAFKGRKVIDVNTSPAVEDIEINAIIQTMVRYTEKPKAVFLITPPHLMQYAKLLLIFIKQLVDLNFENSYITKENQKPLLKTKYMFDELGNWQSEGHGISNFGTMLSIGLGQDQLFTLVLQTLQQLRDIYGDSVDKIIQGNTGNIVYLKSNDGDMIDTLSKLSGTTHKTYMKQKNVTKDEEKLFSKVDSKVTYTSDTVEKPVIDFNDFAFLPRCNSIVVRAGDNPIWNRNEMSLPMSYSLFRNSITHNGKSYSLQTMPTTSNVVDFDIRKNQPNFDEMFNKVFKQSRQVKQAEMVYQGAYGYTDYEIKQLDPDVYADDIMAMIRESARSKPPKSDEHLDQFDIDELYDATKAIINREQLAETAKAEQKYKSSNEKKFADGLLSSNDLCGFGGVSHQFDNDIIKAYIEVKGDMEQDALFYIHNGNLCDAETGELYIIHHNDTADINRIKQAAKDKSKRVFDTSDDDSDSGEYISYEVTDAFIKFLAKQEKWSFAKGRFEQEFAKLMQK